MNVIARRNQALIYRSFYSSYISALIGPRRVGKLTFVKQFIQLEKNEKWVQLNMDQMDQRERVDNQQLAALIMEQALQKIEASPKIWVFIDEAQKCPALFEQIKVLYDGYKDQNKIKFILTGSAALELHQLAAESLAGRIELFHLHAFSLFESFTLQQELTLPPIFPLEYVFMKNFADIPHIANEFLPFKSKLIQALETHLIWGGLPEVLQSPSKDERLRYLMQYLQTYLEKDVRAIANIGNLKLYQQLIDITAEQTGSLRRDENIIQALSCSRDTLNKYRSYLTATLMYCEIYPYVGDSLKRIVKSPKIYLQNNGIVSYLTGFDEQIILEKTGLIGHRLENWFLLELQIFLEHALKRKDIFYWRTSTGVEVDFIVEIKPDIYPFEITYSKKALPKKIDNLQKFMREYNVDVGIYVYMGETFFDVDRGILFLSAWCIG